MKVKKLIDLAVRSSLALILIFKLSPSYKPHKIDPEIQRIVKEIKESPKSNKTLCIQSCSFSEKESFLSKMKGDNLQSIILRVADRYNLDPALIKAVIKVESSFRPHAVSYRGAKGLMQLMPATLRAMGVDDPFDPEMNIDAGARYLKKLLILFDNNLELALAAYNAGIRKVKMYRGIPPFRSTRRYVRRVMYYYRKYREEMEDNVCLLQD